MKRCFAVALVALLSSPATAQDNWPTKPVRVTVPFAPGGAADTAGRLYGDALSQAFGQQFVIENCAGGGGVPVAEAMARAEPDGYSLMVSGIPIIVIGPALRKVGYDPMRDLTHIGYFGGTPNVLTVHPSLGIKTYKEFVAHARKQAGGLDYVSAGFGTMGNLNAEYLASLGRRQAQPHRLQGRLAGDHRSVGGARADRDADVVGGGRARGGRQAHPAGGDIRQPAAVSAERADLPRARPQGFRVAHLVLAVGSGRRCPKASSTGSTPRSSRRRAARRSRAGSNATPSRWCR